MPSIDEHIVRPETREQMVRGRRVDAMPSLPPHGDRHFKLDYVIGAHVKDGYIGSTDLLTRSAEQSDFATDTCVRREGIDPKTGVRYLEELAFEIVNEQRMRDITEQAEDLTARGVRRLVAIFVKKREVAEWTANGWKKLDLEASFDDPTLIRPLRVKELLDAAEADNSVARVLLTKNNPVLVEAAERKLQEGRLQGAAEGRAQGAAEGRAQGAAEGRAQGAAEGRAQGAVEGLTAGIEVACDLLGIELIAERREAMATLDAEGMRALLSQLRTERRWP